MMIRGGMKCVLIGFVLLAMNSYVQATQQPFGLEERGGAFLPDSIYVYNEDSVSVLLDHLINKPTLLVFVYYHCTNLCPKVLEGTAELVNYARVIPGADYQIITISIDEKESSALARKTKQKYLHLLHKPVDNYFWRFFTADSLTIRKLTGAVGWEFRHIDDGFIHPTVSVLITPNKMVSQYFYGTYFNYMHFDFSVRQAANELVEPSRMKNMRYCTTYYTARDSASRIVILTFGFLLLATILFLYYSLAYRNRRIEKMERKQA
jgi:protein SCO1/2